MATYGVTDSGFVVKPLSAILEDTRTALATVSDPVTGESLTPNLSNENDPLINIVNALCDGISVCWEELALCYDQFNPLKATGAGLAGTVLLNGIQKKAGSPTLVSAQLIGTPNLSIASGKQITTVDGSLNFILPAFTFSSGGTATVTATCTTVGANSVPANTVTRLAQYVTGITSVNNSAAGTPGTAEETDAALTARQQGSASSPSRTMIDAIWSNISNLSGVTFCRVRQNIYLTTDDRGIPPKCVAAVVIGGIDEEIARILFCTVFGATHGTTTINLTDNQSVVYPVSFSRPSAVDIYVSVSISIINPGIWPLDAVAQIQQAIIDYAENGASAIGATSGFDQVGYAPGDSVYASELYVPVNSVTGAKVNSLYIGKIASPTGSEVIVNWNELATFISTNIVVVVV